MDDHRKNIEVRGNERSVQRVVNIFQGGVGGFIVRNFCAPRMKGRKPLLYLVTSGLLLMRRRRFFRFVPFRLLNKNVYYCVEKCYFLKGGGGGNGESPSKPLTPLVPSNVTLR